MTLDPIHQFNINNIFTIGHIGRHTIAFTNSSVYMLLTVAVICLLARSRHEGSAIGPRPFPVGRRIELRVRGHHDPLHRRRGRNEVFRAGVLHLHVHFGREPDQHHSLHLHGNKPYHRYGRVRAARFLHGADLWPLQKRLEILQDLRSQRRADVHPAAGRRNRDHFLPVATAVAQRPSVCQHAGRSHHAESVCGLRRHARHFARRDWLDRRHGAARIDRCADRPRTAGEHFCRLTCLRS